MIAPTVTGPDPSLDLISLYGLGPVAQSVARVDSTTGDKINRLRKSYEGKLKGLGLAGRNKPVKQEPGAPGSLRHLTLWPEEEWQNQKVFGKAIKVADMDSELQKLQTRAMQMEPGAVPNNDFWEDVLGHEKPAKPQVSGDTGKKTAPTPAAGQSVNQSFGTPRSHLETETERPRPTRGRKRHYDDNSFVGYGEGYADDDTDAGFYSNGEGTGKKKRKKVSRKDPDIEFQVTNSLGTRTTSPKCRHLSPNEAGATESACLALEPDEDPRPPFFLCLHQAPIAAT